MRNGRPIGMVCVNSCQSVVNRMSIQIWRLSLIDVKIGLFMVIYRDWLTMGIHLFHALLRKCLPPTQDWGPCVNACRSSFVDFCLWWMMCGGGVGEIGKWSFLQWLHCLSCANQSDADPVPFHCQSVANLTSIERRSDVDHLMILPIHTNLVSIRYQSKNNLS